MEHLRYCMTEAFMGCDDGRHPELVMKELGITYRHATPQSIADQWWFWNCENVPNELPPYLTPLNLSPLDAVGHGLSKQEALNIIDHR